MSDADRSRGDERAETADDEDEPEMSDLVEELQELEDLVETDAAREQVREAVRMAMDMSSPDVFGRVIHGYDRADLAETLLGVVVGIVLLTAWGRISWSDPWLAICTTSVAFVPMAIGAALGDILPGS